MLVHGQIKLSIGHSGRNHLFQIKAHASVLRPSGQENLLLCLSQPIQLDDGLSLFSLYDGS